MAILKKDLGKGGSRLSQFSEENLYEVLRSIIEDLQAIHSYLGSHTHGGAAVDSPPSSLKTTIEE